jgi:hypothetical protein
MPEPQNFENHRRLDPLYHFIMAPLLLLAVILALVIAIMGIVKTPGLPSVLLGLWMVSISAGALLAGVKIRFYGLKVQDRVIALEVERRFERLGGIGAPLSGRLKPGQLVALRFAGDNELVALAERTEKEQLTSTAIKKAIQNWRADHRRI